MPIGRRPGGLVRTVGRTAVVAGTASAVAGGVRRRQNQRWADKDQQAADAAAYEQQQAQAQAPPQQAPPPQEAPSQDSVVDQLEKLAKLKEQGVLTDEEFAAQKAKILG